MLTIILFLIIASLYLVKPIGALHRMAVVVSVFRRAPIPGVRCYHTNTRFMRAWEESVSQKTEFSVQNAYRYDRRGPLRWIVSHVWRYRLNALATMSCFILAWLVFAGAPLMI